MKSRKCVIYLLLLSGAVLSIGLAVAYYNTASLGYDNANIFSLNDEALRLFDIRINFEDVRNILKKVMEIFDFDSIVI
jgi:hypothetical protein